MSKNLYRFNRKGWWIWKYKHIVFILQKFQTVIILLAICIPGKHSEQHFPISYFQPPLSRAF